MLKISLFYEVIVRDGKGNILAKEEGECNSVVKNFPLALVGLMADVLNSRYVTLKDTSGVERGYPYIKDAYSRVLWVGHETGVTSDIDKFGIVVGKGTSPVSFDDYKLEDKITHGDGADQLYYGTVYIEYSSVEAGFPEITIYRVFENQGTQAVDVNEIGLIVAEYRADLDGYAYYLVERTVLPSTITVPVGGSLIVKYIMRFEE